MSDEFRRLLNSTVNLDLLQSDLEYCVQAEYAPDGQGFPREVAECREAYAKATEISGLYKGALRERTVEDVLQNDPKLGIAIQKCRSGLNQSPEYYPLEDGTRAPISGRSYCAEVEAGIQNVQGYGGSHGLPAPLPRHGGGWERGGCSRLPCRVYPDTPPIVILPLPRREGY